MMETKEDAAVTAWTPRQIAVLEDISAWDGRAGYCPSWTPKTSAKLGEAGLIELRASDTWADGKGWFLTDAGRAALTRAGGA